VTIFSFFAFSLLMAFDSDLHGHRQPDLRYREGQHPDLLGLLYQCDGHAHRFRSHPHCPEDLRQHDVAPDRSVHRSCRCSSDFCWKRWLTTAVSSRTGSTSRTQRTLWSYRIASRVPALRAKV
jgi:hypothetical protein